MGVRNRFHKASLQKLLSTLFLICLIILGGMWFIPGECSVILLEIAPLSTWFIMFVGAAISDSPGGLIFLLIHYVFLGIIGFLSHVAYIKRKKWMRNVVYGIFTLDMIMNLLTARLIAVLLDIALILMVKFLAPFWKPHREKTIYDWDW